MKRLLILLLAIPTLCWASPPARVNTYSPNTVIASTDVTENEDAIFTYLQGGVDTVKDGIILNDDISASANIQADKLNLTSIAQAVLINALGTFHTDGAATFDAAVTFSSTIGATGVSTFSNLHGTGGALDSIGIGTTTPAAGAFTTLKVGTTNQGDILYDNGTSLVRLTPGTSGYFLKTQGAGANPTWASNTGYSNVLFEYVGYDDTTANVTEVQGTDFQQAYSAKAYRYITKTSGTTPVQIFTWRFIKIANVSTVTINARIWSESADADKEAVLKVDIGGQNNTVTSTTTIVPAWATVSTIDVSSLTNGMTYTITVSLYNEGNFKSYCSAVLLTGS